MQKVFRVTVDISKKIPAPAFEVNTNDLNSVKLEITITNGLSLLDLTGITPRINIRKPDNEVIFQDCEIADAKAGKVQITLENQAYLVPGTHTAEIMCYKGNDVVAVSGTFSYKSTKGIMNDEVVKSKSEFTAIDRKLIEVQEVLADVRDNGTGIDAQARQKVQDVITQLDEKANKNEVQNLVTNKAEKSYVDQITQSLASGSPKRAFTTYSALEDAFPTGDTNIYVVTEDGYWYYWNGTYWEPGGVYQSTGIADSAINEKKLADDVFKAIYSTMSLNWVFGSLNSSTGIPSDSTTRIKTQKIAVNKDTSIDFTDPANVLYYNVARYDKNGTYLGQTGFIRDEKYTFTDELDIIVILAYRTNGTIANPSDINSAIKVYKRALADKVSKNELDNVLQNKVDKAAFSSVFNDLDLLWELGTIDAYTGQTRDSTSRIRTQTVPVKKNSVLRFSNPDNLFYYIVYTYDKFGNFSNTGFITDSEYRFTEDTDVRLILAYKNNREIPDISKISSSISLYDYTLNIYPQAVVKEEKKPISSKYYWSDITFVGDELWAFRPSDDNMAISPGVGAIYIFDEEMNLKKRLLHDFGHVNTVDYKTETDSLIFGNGSGLYGTEGEFYIIKGVKHWGNLPEDTTLNLRGTIEGSTVRTINIGLTFGDKVNVCWGEDNNGLHNICYVLANDNTEIRRLLLGRGANQFENGQFVSGVAADEMNGTYKELKYWYHPKIEVNQGTCYYNGYLWCAMGHDGLFMVRMKLNSDGSISTEIKQELAYKDDGTPITFASEGVAVKDGMLYHATFNGVNAVFKYRPF